MAERLTENMVGAIAYTMKVDGVVVDEVPAADPIEYLHGYANLVPGLEKALEGKTEGDTFSVTLPPEDGFGEYDEDEVDELPRDDFDGFDDLEPGMEVELLDEDGDIFEAVVLEVNKDSVKLDFNPPFAGKTLEYDVKVISVRAASDEEIENGLPESLMEAVFDALMDEDFDHDHFDD